MKLNIIKGQGEDGNEVLIGWNFEAENHQEEESLSIIRDATFFGLKENNNYPCYDGRTNDPATGLVAKLWYKIPVAVDQLNAGLITFNVDVSHYLNK